MGQQQLFIMILVTIVVGISTIVAVTTFDSAAASANQDAVKNDIAMLAASAQDYYLRPELLGGGGREFNGFTIHNTAFPATGITAAGDVAQTENGTYVLTDPALSAFIITAHPSSCDGYTSGNINTDGVLTDYATCSQEADQIKARVTVNQIEYDYQAE